MGKLELYDTTLRDGTQMEGISLSVDDKLKIAIKLDELGVHYIEGGYPGSNPKDVEFFQRARAISFKHAQLAAFGMTRRADVDADKDLTLRSLLDAETPVCTLVGKASRFQVREIIETSLEENLSMIADSVNFLRSHGRKVFFDAEHFFDGFKSDPHYAIQCLRAASDAGADALILCDTNGGALPREIQDAIAAITADGITTPLGIHCHNDADLAVANSLVAVEAGVEQVQGCANGYGERCGNANIFSVIANLKLKYGIDIVPNDQLLRLTEVSHFISEICNMAPNPHQPYVGTSAFSHKGGMHVAAIVKNRAAYEHVPPSSVGNDRNVLVSELAGQRNIVAKMDELGINMPLTGDEVRSILEKVKVLESRGYQYDGSEASFELLVRRSQPGYQPPFDLEDFLVVERRRHRRDGHNDNEMLAEAMVKVKVNGRMIQTASEGNGPVNALDHAVRKALLEFYPRLARVKLRDYKVRILETGTGTSAAVRVLVESSDGEREWRTVGSSTDILEASWLALSDALEWWLLHYGIDEEVNSEPEVRPTAV